MTSPTGTDRAPCSRGFTLLELLVVIAIIGLLATVTLPVLISARQQAKKSWCDKELQDITSALNMYHQEHSAYPPDTQDWSGSGGNTEEPGQVDSRSLFRYLGRDKVTPTGYVIAAPMSMDPTRLTDKDAEGYGRWCDPFHTPYEFDAMHMIPPDPANPATSWRQSGWPYRLVTKDDPTEAELGRMVRPFKTVSYGPDRQSAEYPFDPDPSKPLFGKARDDQRSWD